MSESQATPSLAEASCPPETLRELIGLACLCEAAAPKPGNVHPGASFADLAHADFAAAAAASARPLSRAAETGVGAAVLEAVRATRAATGTNVNLGIALLVAPIAAAGGDLRGVPAVLASLTPGDAAAVYEAINLASAGGLETSEDMDVAGPPPADLLDAMRAAAGRDEIARLYVAGFAPLAEDAARLRVALPRGGAEPGAPPRGGAKRGDSPGGAIVRFFLDRLARVPDTLIARKCGPDVAAEASRRAAAATDARGVAALDRWLRSDGHRRNPGTTADVVAAALFVVLAAEAARGDAEIRVRLEGWLRPPPRVPTPDLTAELRGRLRAVPRGRVTSFGRLAAALGDPKCAVWVARQVRGPSPVHEGPGCGCGRVLDAAGRAAGAACHGDAQAAFLIEEGHAVSGGLVAAPPWWEPPGGGPLEALRRWQVDTAAAAPPPPRPVETDLVAGLDVSYPKGGPPVAACAVVDAETAELVWSTAVAVPARFPYISGYLAFRELPALLAVRRLAADAGVWPGLAMVDGSGVLHPRRAGVAACFAALTGDAAVGVTKKRLTGTFDAAALERDGAADVTVDGEALGVALRPTTGGKPLFVSAGGGVGLRAAASLTRRLMTVHRVPEPVYWADRISRAGVPVN